MAVRLLAKLSLFAVDRKDALPVARLPFYAEVGVRSTLPPLPVALDPRFGDAIQGALLAADQDCAHDGVCHPLVTATLRESLSRLLTKGSRDALAADNRLAIEFLDGVLRRAGDANDDGTLLGVDAGEAKRYVDDAMRAEAEGRGIELNALEEPVPIAWAHPMGILATDHVGYLSYDLGRLPDDVYEPLLKSIEARRLDPMAELDTTIWVYPLGKPNLRYDALAPGRFAGDAVVLRLEVDDFELPPLVDHAGILALQNPDLTDWRLSPASFATNPAALVGADGCETMLPANLALQEFRFGQGVRLTGDVGLGLPAQLRSTVVAGIVHEYRMAWVPLGHSLGQILYSLALAPGESVNLAVIDWSRRDETVRTETSKLDESLVHDQRRDRTISETVKAAVGELQEGSSFMAGAAVTAGVGTAAGAAAGTAVMPGIGTAIGAGIGLIGGLAASIGGSSSDSSGSRQVASDTVQKLSDHVAQASSAMREFQSTVVVRSAQSEHEAIETRTVANYNHSHSLTILYYEVLRHFRLVCELVRSRPAILTNVHGSLLASAAGAPEVVDWKVVDENRKLLESVLLDDRYKEGFAALDRKRHREKTAPAPVPPPPSPPPGPGDRKFAFFLFEMKTGGMFSEGMDDHDHRVEVSATLIGPTPPIELVDPTGSTLLNQKGSFRQADSVNGFVACLKVGQDPVAWKTFAALFLWVNVIGDDSQKVSLSHIKVTGIDVNGESVLLIDRPYEDGHLIVMHEGAHVALPVIHPPAAPSAPGRPPEEIDDDAKVAELGEHLLSRRPYYEQALRLGMTPEMRGAELAGLNLGGVSTLADKVENRPLAIVGDYLAYPCADSAWAKKIADAMGGAPDVPSVERLVTLPTRGVFSEAKLGHCNASEEIDNTRFWDWQSSPIPHMAAEIAPVQAVTPQPGTTDVTPTPFPQSLVNIVNPPSAPDPTGMAAAMGLLGTSNIFRDMSGRAELASFLGKLSDNSLSAAQAQSEAKRLQSKYGGDPSGLGMGTGSNPTLGTPRARPNEPSQITREVQDRQDNALRAQRKGLQTPQQASDTYNRGLEKLYGIDGDDPGLIDVSFSAQSVEPWRELVTFRPPKSVQEAIYNRTGFPHWYVQKVEDGYGDINLDYYPVHVDKLPTIGGVAMTAESLLDYIRVHINDLLEHTIAEFTPFDATDVQTWKSADPINSVIHIDMNLGDEWINPDDGSMVLSYVTPNRWRTSTIFTPSDGLHPVSGNREWGFTLEENGTSYTFYTRGADRISDQSGWLAEKTLGVVFTSADNLWKAFQRKLVTLIVTNGGIASKAPTVWKREPWSEVSKAIWNPSTTWI